MRLEVFLADAFWLVSSLTAAVVIAYVISRWQLMNLEGEDPRTFAVAMFAAIPGILFVGYVKGFRVPLVTPMAGDPFDYRLDYFLAGVVVSICVGIAISLFRTEK